MTIAYYKSGKSMMTAVCYESGKSMITSMIIMKIRFICFQENEVSISHVRSHASVKRLI